MNGTQLCPHAIVLKPVRRIPSAAVTDTCTEPAVAKPNMFTWSDHHVKSCLEFHFQVSFDSLQDSDKPKPKTTDVGYIGMFAYTWGMIVQRGGGGYVSA